MAFKEYWNYLLGQVAELSPLQAPLLVNQAWADIRNAKSDWSFLVKDSVIVVPDAISAGAVTVTQDSATVNTSAAAKAALDAVGAASLLGRVFRAGGAGGPVYLISGYDTGTGDITLDRVYYEASASNIAYLVYGPYVKPASSDFKSWLVVRDPVNGFRIRVGMTRAEVDRMDPQRGATGSPLWLAAKDYDANGLPTYEFWPHPIVRRAYQVIYGRRGTDLSDTVDLPMTIPKELLQERSLYRAYEWCEANKRRFDPLHGEGGGSGPDWRYLMAASEKRYDKALARAKIEDADIFNSQWGGNYLEFQGDGPLDANYWQQHAPWVAM